MNNTKYSDSWATTSMASSPTPGKFPIVALNCFPYKTISMTQQMVEDLIDCGFNAGVFQSSETAITNAFKAIDDADFRMILQHPSLTRSESECRAFVNLYKEKSSLGGWIVDNEAEFEKFDTYAKYLSLISSLDALHPAFPMLYAGANSKLLGAGNDFSTYLNAAQSKMSPSIWAYTFASFRKNGCSSYINGTLFYRDVGLISHKAHSLKRPFWGVCHCQSKVNFDHEFPTPTEAMLRFQVFAAIAAGARGIVFDSYCLTPNNNIQTYLLAPMDSKGNKTPIWHYLKKVITEARSYGDRFMGIEFIECRYTVYAIPGMTHMSGSFGVITRMSTSLAGTMVCHYKSGNKNHMLILNRDVDNFQNIKFETQKNPSIFEVPSYPVLPDVGATPSTERKRTLPPGGYIYLSWDSSVKG